MRILFCSESYAPSVGGVQEVMRQIAERFVDFGHEVHVATSTHPLRNHPVIHGVTVHDFPISGNLVKGIQGPVAEFHSFLKAQDFDVILIKAAQQWTFDALVDVIDDLRARKVFVPCGFSGLYWPEYQNYYRKMPRWLAKFDHLIFYATEYRDVRFAMQHGIEHWSLIPNGADEKEFENLVRGNLRSRYHIAKETLIFMTLGSLTGLKGQWECLRGFAQSQVPGELWINANGGLQPWKRTLRTVLKGFVKGLHWWAEDRRLLQIAVFWHQLWHRNQKVRLVNLPRPELLELLADADLFVFASRIEYSPLVLFEAAAAGLPAVSADVGNAKEIATWLPHLSLMETTVDFKGESVVRPQTIAAHMIQFARNPLRYQEQAQKAKALFHTQFTWSAIARQYERIAQGESLD